MKRCINTLGRTAAAALMAVLLVSGGASARSAEFNESYSHVDDHSIAYSLLEKGENNRNSSTHNLHGAYGVMQDSARVQIIHNSADMMADSVDVYVNDMKVMDNMAFRTATPFMNVLAGDSVVISIAAGNSTDTAGAVYKDTMALTAGMSYIIVAGGIVSETGYNPMQEFALHSFNMALDTIAAQDSVALLFYHGATDAAAIDIVAQDEDTTWVDSLAYGEFSDDYVRAAASEDTEISVLMAEGDSTIGMYTLPLNTFEMGGGAFTILASGFMNQEENSNGPAFGLFMVGAEGGRLIALQQEPAANEARLQLIHNSMDANADTVDVYINNMKVADNIAYATATAFMNVPAGDSLIISFTSSESQDTTGAVFRDTLSLTAGSRYIVVASGMLDSTNTQDSSQVFQLFTYNAARELAQSINNVEVLIHHGASDATAIDVEAAMADTMPALASNLSYGEFSDYATLDTTNVNLDVRTSEGDSLLGTYMLPLEDLLIKGTAITIIAGGMMNPDMNGDGEMEGEAFGLWVAMPEGGPLMPLNSVVASTRKVSNLEYKLSVFPNPSVEGYANIAYELTKPEEVSFSIYDLKGSLVRRVNEGNRAAGQYNLNVSTHGLTRGMYLIKMQTKSTISTLKLVVE